MVPESYLHMVGGRGEVRANALQGNLLNLDLLKPSALRKFYIFLEQSAEFCIGILLRKFDVIFISQVIFAK